MAWLRKWVYKLASYLREDLGTEVPDISIEVDDVDEAYRRMKKAKFKIQYDITNEPWGVRRFYVRDPFGKLVNILSHL